MADELAVIDRYDPDHNYEVRAWNLNQFPKQDRQFIRAIHAGSDAINKLLFRLEAQKRWQEQADRIHIWNSASLDLIEDRNLAPVDVPTVCADLWAANGYTQYAELIRP